MISKLLENSKKIVIKVGSNTLSNKDGLIDKNILAHICKQVYTLISLGKQVVIVTSGARVAGAATIGKLARKEDLHYKQALCAVGQVELMDAYRRCFAEYSLHIGQLLLTREDFSDATRTLNMRNTLFTLLDEGVIPIINENDTVCVEEIKIGDNDSLAALTSNLWNSDLLIILSDIDGIYDKNPKEHEHVVLLEKVTDIDELMKTITIGKANSFGVGGISTKIEAARKVNEYGTALILANGKKEDIITKLLEGTEKATLFLSDCCTKSIVN